MNVYVSLHVFVCVCVRACIHVSTCLDVFMCVPVCIHCVCKDFDGCRCLLPACLPAHISDCFRYQESFHGVNLCSLRNTAVSEYFKQPIVVSLSSFFGPFHSEQLRPSICIHAYRYSSTVFVPENHENQ